MNKSFIDPEKSILIILWRYDPTTVKILEEKISTHQNIISIFHKDELCEYKRSLIPVARVNYRGYYDQTFFSTKKFEWFPLGVRKIFTRVSPSEIKPSFQRLIFIY